MHALLHVLLIAGLTVALVLAVAAAALTRAMIAAAPVLAARRAAQATTTAEELPAVPAGRPGRARGRASVPPLDDWAF